MTASRLLALLAGAGLVWLIVTKSFVAYLANTAPDQALRIAPGDPIALMNLADLTLASKESTDATRAEDGAMLAGLSKAAAGSLRVSDQEVNSWAKAALVNAPFNSRPYRLLGEVAVRSGDLSLATKLMSAAARHSLHESKSVYWLMLRAFEQKDYRVATYYADVLLRTQEQAGDLIVPLLARIAEEKDGALDIKAVLGTNPPWRTQFFSRLPKSITRARTPLDLLLSLQDSKYPPTSKELGSYLDFLIEHQFYDLAYSAWLQFLSTDDLQRAGFLFNGDFETLPSGLPFDWIIAPGYGVTIDITEKPPSSTLDTTVDRSEGQKNQHALFIEFGYGRVDFQPVWHLLLLTPGSYLLSGQYRGDLVGRRGLTWRTDCADRGSELGQSDMLVGSAPTWKNFEFEFKVPDTGCRAQKLLLIFDARSASEQLISGSIWFDELKIERKPR